MSFFDRFRRSKRQETRDAFSDYLAWRRQSVLSFAPRLADAAALPSVWAAVSLIAEAVASLKLKVYKDVDNSREEVTDSWQAMLFKRSLPNVEQSWFEFWEQLTIDLELCGNAFVFKAKTPSGTVTALWALHFDYLKKAEKRGVDTVYTFAFPDNAKKPLASGTYEFTTLDVLHIRNKSTRPGILAPSVFEQFPGVFKVAWSKLVYEQALYENGLMGQTVIKFPATLTIKQIQEFKSLIQQEFAGVANAGRPMVLGGGAEVGNINITPRDAQFTEAINLSVLDIARIFRVPAWLLGVEQSHEKPLSVEHEAQRWFRYSLSPRLFRIESAINSDPDLFAFSPYYARFDTSDLLRGDLATEANIAKTLVQTGVWLVDEARQRQGLPPLPGGWGKTPQPVPVGGSPHGVKLPE